MDYLTCEQVAEIAHCSVSHVREAVKRGEIEAYRPAKNYLFTRESVDKWVKAKAVKQ